MGQVPEGMEYVLRAQRAYPVHKMRLPASRRAVGTARRATRQALEARGLGDITDNALLLVSELVSNAVCHARPELCLDGEPAPADAPDAADERLAAPGPTAYGHGAGTDGTDRHGAGGRTVMALELTLTSTSAGLRIEVHDGDPRPPLPRTPGAMDEHGFGLVLVAALASRWGVVENGHGKTVWAELRSSGGPVAGRAAASRVPI